MDQSTSIALIAVAPFLAACLAPAVRAVAGPFCGWVLAIIPAGIVWALLGFWPAVAGGEVIAVGWDWVPSQGLRFSFLIDGLSLLFALTIAAVGTLIVIYAASYLRGHHHLGRFLAFMLAFTGAMIGVVLADSLITLFTFWELTSVTSFLLIGFDHGRERARRAAIQALVVTNMGGLALLVGAVMVRLTLGSWDLSVLREMGELGDHPAYLIMLVSFLLAAFTKSAQVPFHFWLPNAMEAPTPVSAFLHSATMVQAGVYLLARLHPMFGGTTAWTAILTVFGGVTLIWACIGALRQTDLKMMLAQTTIASLGLLVLLLGIGTEAAIAGAMLYFIAHAAYKAGFFLLVGVLDHGTGSRDMTALGGLRRKMPLSFLAALLCAFTMIGLPPAAAFLAKEEMYLALVGDNVGEVLALAVLIFGNAVFTALALVLVARPFLGPLVPTPKKPHEGGAAMILPPLLLGLVGILAGLVLVGNAEPVFAAVVGAILGHPAHPHLTFAVDLSALPFWLSILTWAIGIALFVLATRVRVVLRRVQNGVGWSFDKLFDAAMFSLIRFAGAVTRLLQHGRLELHLVTLFALLAIAVGAPMLLMNGLPAVPAVPNLAFYEWGVVGIALVGLVAVVVAHTRLTAIVSLGVQGAAVALVFLLFGAPDLAFTQVMVEILSVVVITLVMTRLSLDQRDPRRWEDFLRDGALALLCGLSLTLLLMRILQSPLDLRLSTFFAENSYVVAHGRNIVNVILVDFRGLDTLGEISVVMTAGIAILALIRRARAPLPDPVLSSETTAEPEPKPLDAPAAVAVEAGA